MFGGTSMRSHLRVCAKSLHAISRRPIWKGDAILLALSVGGCTHLAVTPDRLVSDNRDKALSGVTYSLPMLQFDLAVTRTLTACPVPVVIESSAVDAGGTFWSDDLAVDLEVSAVANQISGERYRIDYSKLDSAFKTTSFTIEYQPGGGDLLKSVNVSVEDHTGEVIGNVVKAGLAVAATAANPAGAAAAAAAIATTSVPKAPDTGGIKSMFETPAEKAYKVKLARAQAEAQLRGRLVAIVAAASTKRSLLTCTVAARADVEKRKALAEQLEKDRASLAEVTSQVTEFTKLATVKALTEPRRTALGNKMAELLALTKKVADGQASLAKVEERLGVKLSESWPKQFRSDDNEDVAPPDPDERAKLEALFASPLSDAHVIDPNELAKRLVASGELKAFRVFASKFVGTYVNEDDTPKSFKQPLILDGCSGGTITTSTCVTSMTTLVAKLVPVAADALPVTCEKNSKECIINYADAVKSEKAAWDKKRTPTDQRRSTLPYQVDARSGEVRSGLFVRPPVRATLLICRKPSKGEASSDGACAKGTRNLVKDDKVLVPQLGQLRYFRLVNQAFSNNGLTLILTKEGAIEKFQYASSKSIAQGLSAAVADAATQYAAFDKQRDEKKLKDEDPVAALQKQIDLKTAQQKVAAFDAVKSPTELEVIQLNKAKADLAYVQAQTTYLEAQAAIFASQAAEP